MSEENKSAPREDAAKSSGPRGWRLINFVWLKNPPTALAAAIYVAATLFALAVLVLVGFGLFASFQIAYETATGKFADRIEAAKVFFPILLALVGGPLLMWRVITAHIQAQATRRQAENYLLGLHNEVFAKAIEQLGATRDEVSEKGGSSPKANLDVRLGAVMALGQLARNSAQHRLAIERMLSAYIRNSDNSGTAVKLPADVHKDLQAVRKWVSSLRELRSDIQTSLVVIGQIKHTLKREQTRLFLIGTNLQRADLRTLDFSFSEMGRAALHGAVLFDSNLEYASLMEADLTGAWVEGARFYGAIVVGADLSLTQGLLAEQINFTLGDIKTLLPSHIARPAHWPVRELSWEETRRWYFEVRQGGDPKSQPSWLS